MTHQQSTAFLSLAREYNDNDGKHARAGFSLVELMVCIAIIGLLAALLFPVLQSALASGRSTKCLSNLQQIGAGLNLYASENDGYFPKAAIYTPGDNVTWMRKVAPYLNMPDNAMGLAPLPRSAGVFQCPDFKAGSKSTDANYRAVAYALNCYIDPIAQLSSFNWNYRRVADPNPSNTFLVVECSKNDDLFFPQSTDVSRRHPGKSANFLFVDGHVESLRDKVPSSDLRWRW